MILIALAVSTVLNALYFMRTVIRIYRPDGWVHQERKKASWSYTFVIMAFVLLNVFLGICSQPLTDMITLGLSMLE